MKQKTSVKNLEIENWNKEEINLENNDLNKIKENLEKLL